MKHVIFGTLRKIEYRCMRCGKWTDRGACDDHPTAGSRLYHSYEIDAESLISD